MTAPPAPAVVVLAYHRISRRPLASGTWVTPRQLARHLDVLVERGHPPLTPAESRVATRRRTGVLLTFDDGTADLATHAEVLASRGAAGLVFVPADLIARRNRWEWPLPGRATRHLAGRELRELVAAGWEVGLHGASHCDLTRLDAARLAVELGGGRRRLEDRTGQQVRSLAYPFGRTDARVAAAVVAAGITEAYVLTAAPPDVPRTLARRRRPVYCIDGAADIAAKVADPAGRTFAGRWQRWKEGASHGVGRWTARVSGR